ncbi:egl nine homolog 1 [Condylostylus longicornis]|uniref:egl nine homolog 1 n=1 Tax=Condylostylus longicornis TaxID=2530218 RepID=UPI00244DA2C0|nr:egl nine homolog 1 [Condylostylus longicornis]
MEIPFCNVCKTTQSLLRCGKCKQIYYCSTDHQHLDWQNHKHLCRQITKQKKENQIKPPHFSTQQSHQVSFKATDGDKLSSGSDKIVPEISSKNSSESVLNIRDEKYLSLELNSTSERRYEELCRIIINDMNTYGLSVVDDFLGAEKGLQILNEVHKMYAAGVFKDGQLVSNSIAEEEKRTIRGDKITWVRGTESGCINIGYLINQIDAVVSRANTMHENGQLGNYKIRERTKAMVACYPGSGAHYVMHVDNPNKDGRVITAIYYLNINWDIRRSGGILRIFPENGSSIADIEPKFDRLIFFWSDRRNPHEVQPAHRTRYAITVWYFDANEREAALNRHKPKHNSKTNQT